MRYWKPTALMLAASIGLAACGHMGTGGNDASADPTTDGTAAATHDMTSMPSAEESTRPTEGTSNGDTAVDTAAANLRVDLNYLLGEHLTWPRRRPGPHGSGAWGIAPGRIVLLQPPRFGRLPGASQKSLTAPPSPIGLDE